MKILLTGGGSGGHFYPLIAIAEELRIQLKAEKLIDVKMYYMANTPYDERLLFENNIEFKKINTGKVRAYFSMVNILDFFKTILASFKAIFQVYALYPDVVVSKGGGESFPVVFAARILRIPVIIHESDSVPGKANKYAAKFAQKIAVSYPGTAAYFPKEKTALTGQPIRKELLTPIQEGAHQLLRLEEGVPVILILGGSQGSAAVNESVLQAAPKLVEKYQIIHQVGENNVALMQKMSRLVLEGNERASRYRVFPFLNVESLRMAAGVADLIISRAGSTIFEIAAWGIPSIIIPLETSAGDHQRKNAFAYTRAGACSVIEEANLSSHILFAEVTRLMTDQDARTAMIAGAQAFASKDAAALIAQEVINILLRHKK